MRAPVDPDQEARRLACLLTNLLKMDGRTPRSAEDLLGLGRSGLSKLRDGKIRLQVKHLVAVLDLLEMSPARFFQMAYPKERLTHRVKRELWRTRILLFDGDREPEETPGFAARLRRAFLRIFARILHDEGFEPGPTKARS